MVWSQSVQSDRDAGSSILDTAFTGKRHGGPSPTMLSLSLSLSLKT